MTMTADADAAEAARAPHEIVYRPEHPLDLLRTVGMLRRGRNDPTTVIDGGVIWRALRTPSGIATIALRASSGEVRATAWDSSSKAVWRSLRWAASMIPLISP